MSYPIAPSKQLANGKTLTTPPYLRRVRGWLKQTTSSFAPAGEKWESDKKRNKTQQS
jgi:hypothetical protein